MQKGGEPKWKQKGQIVSNILHLVFCSLIGGKKGKCGGRPKEKKNEKWEKRELLAARGKRITKSKKSGVCCPVRKKKRKRVNGGNASHRLTNMLEACRERKTYLKRPRGVGRGGLKKRTVNKE